MNITRITGHVRGRDIDYEIGPMTAFIGPSGAGKSTALLALRWALDGAVARDGREPSKTAAAALDHLSAGGEPVWVTLHLDDDGIAETITRTLDPDAKPQESVDVSWAATKGAKAGQAAIDAQLGKVSGLDVGALLAMLPGDRRSAIAEAVVGAGADWTATATGARLLEHANEAAGRQGDDAHDGDPLTVDEIYALAVGRQPDGASPGLARKKGEDVYDMMTRRAALLADAAKTAEGEAAAAELRLDAAKGAADISAPSLRATEQALRAARGRVETLVADAARCSPAERSQLERRIDVLAGGPDLASLEAAVVQAMSAHESAAAALAAVVGANPGGVPIDADGFDVEQAVTAARAALTAAERQEQDAERALTAAHAAARDTDGTCCPTCQQELPADVLESRAARRAETLASVALVQDRICALHESVEDARIDVEMAEADLRVHRERVAAERAEADAAVSAWRGRRIDAQRAVDDADRALNTAQSRLAAERRAAADIAATREKLAAMGDHAAVTAALDDARAEVARLESDRDRAKACADALTAQARLGAEAVDARRRAAGLRLAAKSWQGAQRDYAAAAVGPFVIAVESAMPEGWALDVDIAAMRLTVRRVGHPPVLVDALSRGEQATVYAAIVVGLAAMRCGGLRLVVADHCESVSDVGIWGAMLARLRSALERGDIDQVVVATNSGAHRGIVGATVVDLSAEGVEA